MAINAGIITFVSLVLPSVHGCVAPPHDPGPSADPTASSHNRSPASAVVVAAILALLSLAIGLSSIYIRRCTDSPPPPLPIAAISTTASRFSSTVGAVLSFPSRHHDLDPLALDMLPTFAYGEAKGREDWIGRVEECAVCLSEFEEPDSLRLLPRCGHAFHAPCIDKWLAKHVGCPVCRSTVAGDR